MRHAPKISVIMPAYGHRDYILKALDSVFNQSHAVDEVIVVNDDSPDDSEQLLLPLAQSGKIKYHKQKNGGAASARNTGLEMASGDYVAFLDDDDVWPPNRMAYLMSALSGIPDASAIGGRHLNFYSEDSLPNSDSKSKEALTSRELKLSDLFKGNPFISPGQVLFSRKCLVEIGGFNTSIWGSDDFEILFRLASVGPIHEIDQTTLFYRLHSTNASRFKHRLNANTRRAVNLHIGKLNGAELRTAQKNYLNLRFGMTLFPYLALLKENVKRRGNGKRVPVVRLSKLIYIFLRRSPGLVFEMIHVFLPYRKLLRRSSRM